ncbi:MAG: YceD family protein [Nitriliruptorales bacterium]
MRVDVTDLIGHPGASRGATDAVRREDVATASWGPADDALASPISYDLVLEMLVDGLLATGTMAFTTSQPCARCLVGVVAEHDVEVSELYADPARLAEEDDEEEVEVGYELHPLEGCIDLEAMVRDTVVAAVPVRTLCREDCQGLCPTCGADRNRADCGHRYEPEVDPRWAVLQDLDVPPR